jgi:tryptophan 2,3-dioxygenase
MQIREPQQATLGHGIDALLDSPYARYLDLETVFRIQLAEHEGGQLHHQEEVLFRSVHISSELWLRLAGYELERAAAAMDVGHHLPASRLIRRSVESITRVIEATGMLEGLPATAYHQFRVHFGEASGLQSPGYAYVRRLLRGWNRTIDELFPDDDALYELYNGPHDTAEYDVCEALLDLDATLERFRSLHIQIAQRFLGELTAGTGGTAGIPYLRNNLGHQAFPRLWQVRDRLANASGAGPYGYGNPSERR